MELFAGEKSHFIGFRTRATELKKQFSELCTLYNIEACMIIYGPDRDGSISSQPEVLPENLSEVDSIVKKYMKRREKSRRNRRPNLFEILENREKKGASELPALQKEIAKKMERNLEGTGIHDFPYQELIDIVDKLKQRMEEMDDMAKRFLFE